MFTISQISDSRSNSPQGPHRAVVTYSSSASGEIRVLIPASVGTQNEVSISYIGRKKHSNGLWSVPAIGSQIVVSADDVSLTNVFWIQTEGISALEARVAVLETLVDQLMEA